MLDKTDFNRIRSNLDRYDSKREELIKKAREVLKLSKQLIYSVHRNDLKEADGIFTSLKKEKINLDKIAVSHKNLFGEGSYSEAMQEYVEAICLYEFIYKNKVPTQGELYVSAPDYLSGLCDLTGELMRKANYFAINGKVDEASRMKELVDKIYEQFLFTP